MSGLKCGKIVNFCSVVRTKMNGLDFLKIQIKTYHFYVNI